MRKHVTAAVLLVAALCAVTAAQATTYPKPPQGFKVAVHQVFKGRGEQTVTCLAWAESHYGRTAWSSSGDHGYLQINYRAHHRPGESEAAFHARMSDTMTNVHFAWKLSHEGRSWWAWTGTYGKGECHGLN